jgi:hypothetical protein
MLGDPERFVLYTFHFSPGTLALCPDLPAWVFRIYDRYHREHVHFEGNRDPVAAKEKLADLTANGRANDSSAALAQAAAARWRAGER